MPELGIRAKLIRLCRLTLSNSCSSAKVGNLLIPCEVSDKTTPYSVNSSTFSWRVCYGRRCASVCIAMALFLQEYADEIDIIGRTMRDVTAAFSAI